MEQTKLLPIDQITKNPDNPRIIRDEKFKKLVKSLQDFPEMMNLRPVVVNPEMMILGGNMRYEAAKAAGWAVIPTIIADLSPDQQREFIIKDNVSGGEWDFDALANSWDTAELGEWGVDLPVTYGPEIGTDEFTLPDGDKTPFQQMTFTLADAQAVLIHNAIADIKKTDEYKFAETHGNENSNGNALYLIVAAWAGQRI